MDNNRWARLSQSQKAELLGLYTSMGYNDLASIIAHYNSCGGKLKADGGPVTNTAQYKSDAYLYNPPVNVGATIEVPLKYKPLPNYGDYEYPASAGVAEGYPITTLSMIAAPTTSHPEEVVEDLFSEEAMTRRALKQRYAESNFDNKVKSHAGAIGAWQIMPITYKDYLERGRGKAGDLNDPEYNRKVRDWVMSVIPRDLQDLYSETDAPRVKLAKIYGAYNWGAGNMRKYLREQRRSGVDISNDTSWVEGLNPETKRYIKYLALDEDIPDSTYTNKAFEEAAVKKGYMAEGGQLFKDGGKIHIKPENRGKFTALKKRTGHSASWFKAHGTPAQKKMATFALNARKWKHEDGGPLVNYLYDGGPYNVIPLGGDYLTYLQTTPEVSGGVIEPSVVTAKLPPKFNGSQTAAARYAEGYQKGAKPVSEAISRSGQNIFNAIDTVVGLTPTPAGAISWLGHIGADTLNGKYGKVGKDLAMAAAMGFGFRAVGRGASFLKNYWNEIGDFGEDTFRAFTDSVPGRVNTNFTHSTPATRVAVETAPAVTKTVSAPYEIENLGGGYMLKSLMRGNPLEKQISKNGTVNVSNVRALVGKGNKVEQAVVDKVLASEEFAGKKSIDYNQFRKAVQDELITYERTPDTRWNNYGVDKLGISSYVDAAESPEMINKFNDFIKNNFAYDPDSELFFIPGAKSSEPLDPENLAKMFFEDGPGFLYKPTGVTKELNTFTFSSPRIPNGSARHYDQNTLGHSRTYITTDEPDVLHVMESQSDWAQTGGGKKNSFLPQKEWEELIANKEKELSALERSPEPEDKFGWEALERIGKIDLLKIEIADAKRYRDNANKSWAEQVSYLGNDYTSRQIQENLRYAAEKGQTKMRYPTRETVAKIEGYQKHVDPVELHNIDAEAERELFELQQSTKYNDWYNELRDFYNRYEELTPEEKSRYDRLRKMDEEYLEKLRKINDKATAKKQELFWSSASYSPEHEGILRKYDAFPKQYRRLYKDADIRTVTDSRGNTWYEVDVPENYLKQEWAYKYGGSLREFYNISDIF